MRIFEDSQHENKKPEQAYSRTDSQNRHDNTEQVKRV